MLIVGAGGIAVLGAGVLAFAGTPSKDSGSATRALSTSSAGANDVTPLPPVAGRFGDGRLIKYAAAGRVGSELAVALTLQGKKGARREVLFRQTLGDAWVRPKLPPIEIGSQDTFSVTGMDGSICLVLVPKKSPQLRCARDGDWETIGAVTRITGVRSINDVATVGGDVYATTGGTGADHRPEVHVLRWRDGRREDLGAVDSWAAQRGYFALGGGKAKGRICGVFNDYAPPSQATPTAAPGSPPVGTFCVEGNAVARGIEVPDSIVRASREALPTSTDVARYDMEPSGRLDDGSWAIAAVSLGRSGAGTLAYAASESEGWSASPLSKEAPDVSPYGGIWTVGMTTYLLNAELNAKAGHSQMTLASLEPGETAANIRSLATAPQGYQVALGVFERRGVRYALFTDSRPEGTARLLSVAIER